MAAMSMMPGGRGPSGPPAAPGMADASGMGIPQPMGLPSAAPGSEALSEILMALQGGQVGADKFLQLLSLLASQSLPQMQAGPGMQPGPQMQQPQAPPQDIQRLMMGG